MQFRYKSWHEVLGGISLLIGAMAQHHTLNLYHYRIIFDLVNLTGWVV